MNKYNFGLCTFLNFNNVLSMENNDIINKVKESNILNNNVDVFNNIGIDSFVCFI